MLTSRFRVYAMLYERCEVPRALAFSRTSALIHQRICAAKKSQPKGSRRKHCKRAKAAEQLQASRCCFGREVMTKLASQMASIAQTNTRHAFAACGFYTCDALEVVVLVRSQADGVVCRDSVFIRTRRESMPLTATRVPSTRNEV